MHRFRFGVVAAFARSGDEWVAKARHVESLGYATLVIPDNLRHTLAPLPALSVAAAATRDLRVGTYVLANDLRHPVLLAKDAASLDVLSGGRLELGIGAGRPNAADDYRMLGLPFEPGHVRLARLAESLSVLKALLAGQPVPSSSGAYYAVSGAEISPRPLQQPRPPILVAGSGPQMLALAAREADIVALGVPPTATEADVAEKVSLVREAAGSTDRFERLELNINLMAVGHDVPRYVAAQMGLSADDLARAGAVSALVGSPDEMCDTLQRRRDKLGISYVLVSDELMEGLAPVVERLAGR
jgi:probable F420-dependent oxidoreductase